MSLQIEENAMSGFKSHLRAQPPKVHKTLDELLALDGAQLVAVKGSQPDPDGREFQIRADFALPNGKTLWAAGSILQVPFAALKKLAPELIGRAGGFYAHQALAGDAGLLNRGWEYSMYSEKRVGENGHWGVNILFHTPSGFRIELRDIDANHLPEGMEKPGWLKAALRAAPRIRHGKTEKDHAKGTATRAAAARAVRAAESQACKGAPAGGGGKKGGDKQKGGKKKK